MNLITQNDLILVNDLSNRKYSGNTMSSNSTENEIKRFKEIKNKLKSIADNIKNKYDSDYGKLDVSVSSGNPIAIGGIRLNRIWSGLFKGASNKQYSAQISFVMNPNLSCLDVGFYFGRASAHNLKPEERNLLEERLNFLGRTLVNEIKDDEIKYNQFNKLFDYGFSAYISQKKVTSDDWLNAAIEKPKEIHIVYHLYPNEEGYIENSTINLYVSMIVFLLGLIPQENESKVNTVNRPLTAEQRAKQAERRTLIGEKGELFILQKEIEKLKYFGIDPDKYLKHVSTESMSYGYDILSCNEEMETLFIEVKTTTRQKSDKNSKSFSISSNEYDFFKRNSKNYKLIRVYDIEGENPEFEEIDMNKVEIETESYVVNY